MKKRHGGSTTKKSGSYGKGKIRAHIGDGLEREWNSRDRIPVVPRSSVVLSGRLFLNPLVVVRILLEEIEIQTLNTSVPHSVSLDSVPEYPQKKGDLCSSPPFWGFKKMSRGLILYKYGAFRGQEPVAVSAVLPQARGKSDGEHQSWGGPYYLDAFSVIRSALVTAFSVGTKKWYTREWYPLLGSDPPEEALRLPPNPALEGPKRANPGNSKGFPLGSFCPKVQVSLVLMVGRAFPGSMAWVYFSAVRLATGLTLRGPNLAEEPLGFGALDSHQCLRYSSRHFRFRFVPYRSPRVLHSKAERSPPHVFFIPRFGQCLSPVHSSAQERSISGYYALFQRVAASRQTSWLSLHPYLLYHEPGL
ncbi:hypothetical protein OSB04_un001589 [Centaurea solstitialis]|uniref:Uncharacterized protein n=1 Tax=Centaurea solstitialis TaxID=347529 RepID=A0AA38SLJ2_9ASTR|nr:hypothetical protein OSB04_un001589 [Centaurea solstitialis]